ncbi:MAG: hypothetical protein A2927_00105 [Candidatus Komeilibacteria bacterium RIFCSPLOWO2_01_FULL_45_10]|uniref:GtrA/DPMS transmembrane domain-containing protein n=1 Tax=Candidatus Komeilibacteria bacterium RIFCSPLOWO2_01_FULL_45_10 TaxID=1798550 RepID=A0A1G2BN49_9BACT|nr:MAG: hypothetical protein A2927_00105 [Candidatus Komeilibacteria bacterium RIFCSPLOWO2_01_FULL_45_10]
MIEKIIHYLISQRILNRFPVLKQFIRFSLVGVISTLIDFLVYFGLTRLIVWFGHYYLVANAISFTLAVINSFILNRHWTFADGSDRKLHFKFIKFFIVNFFTLIVVELSLYYLVEHLLIYDLFAKILVLLISVISNFCLIKFWVFKK